MNKVMVHTLGIMLGVMLILSILPTGFGACDYSIDVYAGQQIALTATPNTPVGAYDYLWVTQGGITLPSDVSTDTIIITAPTQGGQYSVTTYVSNHNAPPNTCIDSKTICINVIGTTFCPLCSGDFCLTAEATAPDCPPVFHYTGLKNANYVYHYATLDHGSGSEFYQGVTLATLSDPNSDYTLDWNLLDQPHADETMACTTVRFWITSGGSMVGTACERTICLYWDPTAGIIPVY
jgi:hypothetical protein